MRDSKTLGMAETVVWFLPWYKPIRSLASVYLLVFLDRIRGEE
jgi:hypothetical protein